MTWKVIWVDRIRLPIGKWREDIRVDSFEKHADAVNYANKLRLFGHDVLEVRKVDNIL